MEAAGGDVGKKAAVLTGRSPIGEPLPPFPGLELQPRVGLGLICAPLMSPKVSGSSTGGEFQ